MIELISRKQRDSKRQVAFIKVDGQEFSVGNVPAELTKDADVLKLLEAREGEFKFLILLKQYRDADYKAHQKEGMTDLQAMKAWVTAGCQNRIQVGLYKNGKPKYGYEVIERQEMEYKHPPGIALAAEVDSASTLADLKEVVKKSIMA